MTKLERSEKIIGLLRNEPDPVHAPLATLAADRIEELQGEVKRLGLLVNYWYQRSRQYDAEQARESARNGE